MSRPEDPAGICAALRAAEDKFLLESGWSRIEVRTWNQKPVTQWRDPKDGSIMDAWVAVAKQKSRFNYD